MNLLKQVDDLLYQYSLTGDKRLVEASMGLLQQEMHTPSLQEHTITLPMSQEELVAAVHLSKGYLVVQNEEADSSGEIEPGLYVRVFANDDAERSCLCSVACIQDQFTILVFIDGGALG